MSRALLVGTDSDLATLIANELQKEDWSIVGSSRKSDKTSKGFLELSLDLGSNESIGNFCVTLASHPGKFDLVCFTAGTMIPLGPFSTCDNDAWDQCFQINFLGPLRILRSLIALGKLNLGATVMIFGGGGINSSPINSSAYTLSKIALTKAIEILSSEHPEFNFISLGTGWLRTKIHEELLNDSNLDSKYKEPTLVRFQNNDFGKMIELTEFIKWALKQDTRVTSGRNFSLQGDPWSKSSLQVLLLSDPDLFKLRRKDFRGKESTE
jgi:NAD(P)-dependent dehydrogenase (short-subunit alcohol dehydrogenase family)